MRDTIRLDHVPFGAADANTAAAAMSALGFSIVLGECRWPMPAASFCAPTVSVMFRDSYLDLVAYEDRSWADRVQTSDMYRRGLIPAGVVLGTDDFDQTLAATRSAQTFEVEPYEILRTLETPPQATIRYRISPLRSSAGLPLSVLQDHQPHAMRTPQALAHRNGATALARVVLRIRNVATAAAHLTALFGRSTEAGEDDRIRVQGVGPILEFVHEPSPGVEREVAERLPRKSSGLLLLEFRVGDLDRTVGALRQAEVSFDLDSRERVVVGDAGFGCAWVFGSS